MFTAIEAKELLDELEPLSREPTLSPKARLVVKALVADIQGDADAKEECMKNLEWLRTHTKKPTPKQT